MTERGKQLSVGALLANLALIAVVLVLALRENGPIRDRWASRQARAAHRETVAGLWEAATAREAYRLSGDRGDEQGIEVLEFIDYQCRFCRANSSTVDGMLRRGDLSGVVVLQFPLTSRNPESVNAAMTALCAGEAGVFPEVHRALLADDAWLGDESLLRDLAISSGVEPSVFDGCMGSEWVVSELDRHRSLASALSVEGTPAFVSLTGFSPGILTPAKLKDLR
jgi:protein-disulfide isomerase